MATEEKAREATDGQEVQVEDVDLGTTHLQTHLEGKLSSNKEIKDVAKIMDSTEGMLKIPEDQVLVEAPSEVKIPPELYLNGTASSLNGHMDKEEKISNEQAHENDQKYKEQAEVSPDGISTDQSNKSNNEEVIGSLGHGESTTENTRLLKHENEEPKEHSQQELEGDVMDDKMVQEDTLKTDNAVERTVDPQQGHNMETAKATEDTQPASMSNIPDDEVVAEAPVGVETPLEPNVDDSDPLTDTTDGNTETVEPAKADDAAHHDHKESSPEDKDIAERTDEVAKVEDQQSKQTDTVGGDVVQEEIPKSKETEVQEEMPNSEEADDSTIDAQVLNQESPEETNDHVYEKTEETTHQRSVATSEETTPEHVAMREPDVNIQEENQRSVEEMIDAEAIDTEKTMQQSSAAFEEEITEDHVATTAPSSDIQHAHNVESEEIKGLEDAIAEETSNESNVAFAEDAVQGKVLPSEPAVDIQPVQGLGQEETENNGTVEMDEASNQTHAAVHNNLAQEDGIAASEPHVTELAEEVEDIEDTETQEITHQCHAATSKELPTEDNSPASEPHNDDIQRALEQDSVEVKDTEAAETQGICHERTISTSEEDTLEDNVTAEGPACDTQEVQSVESPEEIKDNIAENIIEASNATTVDEADQENNVLVSETIAKKQTRGLEPEEIKNTEPVEIEASDQRPAAIFNDLAQEDNTTANEMQESELAVGTKEIEATKTEAIPQESNASISEEPTPEDIITASETTSDTQEVNNVGSAEAIEDNTDAKTGEISDHSNESFAVEAVEGNDAVESEPNADIQPVQELELEEMMNTELVAVSETSHQMEDAVFQKPTEEDNPTASGLHVIESAGEVSNIEAQANPHQTDVPQSDKQATEENTAASEPQILEPESVEEIKDTDATEPQGISQQSIISTSEESVPEENVTEKGTAYDNKEVQNEEPELIEEHDDVKADEISNQSSGPIISEAAQENILLASEPTNDVQVKGLESEEIRNIEDVGTEEASHQTHVATVEESLAESQPQMIELSEQMNDVGLEPTLHGSNVASIEEMATEDNATIRSDVGTQPLQEQESVQFRDIKAIEPQGISPSHNVSTSEESTPEDNVTTTEPSSDTQAENLESAEVIQDIEDMKSNAALAEEATPEEHVLITEATIDVPPVQEPKLEETKNTEPVETQDNITASGLPAEELKDTEAMENEEIPHESTVASINELTEDVKSNVALADEAAPEEHVLVTGATVKTPPVQEPVLEEVKNSEPVEVEDTITASDLPAEEMKDTETMETEAIPYESTVARIKELTEDGILTASAPQADIQQVPEQESVEDMKCTATTEYQGEPQQSTVSTSDEHTSTEEKTTVTDPTCDTQVQNVVAQEIKDSEDVKTEEFSDHSTFSTPEVAAQESAVPRSKPTSDAQQVQEHDSTEETGGIEAVKTEDHQQHGVSTLEKPVAENNVTENEPKVDDQQVQEEKSAVEVKDIEAMETEEISDQSNISTSANAAQEISELGSDPDFYVQPAQQLELAEDSKDSQLVKAEETGHEEPTAEDNATNEIGPPADIKKEHELESVEEIKDIDATEAEKASHTSQAAALEVPLSESNIATTEPTYDIQQVNDLEATKEMKATEAINDEEISCQRTEIAVLEDQSSTDNGTAPEELPVESNEENFGNENDNVMLVHEKIKEEIQEPTELKDEASNLGEKTVFTTQKGENITEVDAVQISGEDTIETSHNIDQIKEEQKAVTEHDSSQMSSGQREENITHVQDRDIKGELLTESGTEQVSQASFENGPQAAQDVAEKDDTIKSGEQTNDEDNEQHHDQVLQTQVCERSMDALAIGQQEEDVQKVNLDQQQKEGEEIEAQTEEIQTDEQKHDDKRADFTTEPLVEPQSVEVVTNRTDDTDFFEAERTEMVVTEMLKNEHTLHVPQESIPRITDANVENITERKEGTEEENEPNNAGPLDADAENYNEDEQENAEKDVVVAKASTDEHYETTDEIRNEEKNIEIPDEQEPLVIQVELGLSSSVEKDLQEITDPAPSKDEMQENVSDENLATTEHNGVEDEAVQQKIDSSNAETNNDDILSISNPLPEHETGTASDITQNRQYQEATNADDVLQLEPEENAFDKIAETDSNEKMETSHTAATEAVTFDEDTYDKASGADGALSNESFKTFEDARRNLDVSSVVTVSKGDNINEEMEDRKLALPAQTTLDVNTTEQGSGLEETERELSLSEKPLPSEPEEQEENRITKEQDEEDMHEPEIVDTQKEAEESDLPVSNFLMNLILGKESNDPNGNSESEAEKKQEEITKDDSCSITFQQEESSVSFPAENKEVRVEDVDLGTTHLQTHLDGKLSSNKEIKDEAKIMDSTEGMLKIPEDQVLVEAPSEVKIPPELYINGTASSLNGHMDKEENILNEQPRENDQKHKEQAEVSPDGISTDQSDKSNNEEVIGSLGHGESTTENTSLLKHENEEPKEHGQQELEGDVMDDKMVQEDTLKTDNAVEPTVDPQQGHNMETAKATEDTQPASMSNIPDDEVAAEAPVGVETPPEPNVDDSDPLTDTTDGNTETVEPTKADDAAHHDHKESSPEDKDIAERIDEVAKVEDQHSKQTDTVGADVVQEEIPKSRETEVHKEMPNSEEADDSTIDAQVLNQESPEETNDHVYEKTEETSHQSSVASSEETTPEHVAMREPDVNIQEENQGSVEEMIDAEAIDTEKTMQQSSAAFEEEITEDHVATTTPSSDIQHAHNVESEEIKGLGDAIAEETSNESNVAFAEDAVQGKVLPSEPAVDIQPVQGLGQEETENNGTVEMDEASNQTHAAVHNNLAQEDGITASEPHVTELAEEVEDIEATETQEITHQCHAATSKELPTEDNSPASEPHNDDIQRALEQDSVEVKDTEAAETQGICHERTISTSEEDTVEDNVTAEGPTCDTQEVQSVESPEEIKDNIAENIIEASNATTVDEADQENNVLVSETIAKKRTQGLEPEEIKNTGPLEIEAYDQRPAAIFNDLAQEDNTTANEMQESELAVGTKEIEATKTEAIPQESNASISEEPTPEDIITASETTSDTQEVNNVGSAEAIEDNTDAKTGEISDHSNESFAVEAVEGNDAVESEPNADIQPVQELELEEMMNTELVAVSKTSHQMEDAVFQKPTEEDNPTASGLHVIESAGEVSSIEAQATPHQTDVPQSDKQATEENTAASEPQILEPESVEEIKDTDATEPQGISQQSIISTSEESVPEENVTAKGTAYDNKEVQNEEPELIEEHDDVKADEISNQSSGPIISEAAQENILLASEPTNDVQVKGLESEEIRNIEDVGTEEASHQTHVAAVEENLAASEPQMIELSEQMNDVGLEPTLHGSSVASIEEMATEDNATIRSDVGTQPLQEQESVQFRDIKAIEPQGISPSHNVSTSEESTPEDNVTTTEPSSDTQAENLESAEVIQDIEDMKSNAALAEEATPEEHVLITEATIDVPPVQEPKLEETKNTEPVETQDNITASGLPAEELKDTEAMENEEIPHESTVASISELTEDVKSNVALADEAAPEEHVLVTGATVKTPPVQEPELEEVKNSEPVEVEDTITASDLPAEEMKDTETMETEAIPYESTVARIKELTEDGILTASAPHADIQQVPEQESVEDMKCTATTEYQGEPQQSTVSTSDEHTSTEEKTTVTDPTCDTQVQNVVAQEIKDSEDVKTEEFSDHSNFSTPEVAAQESAVPRSKPTSDAQQVQEHDSTEETGGIEAVKTEDHQQHGVSTLEKPVAENNVTESEPKVDDQQVQEEKSAVEVKDIEAMETKEISDQSNISTSENAAQEISELGSDPDFYVQPAQQLELAEDSKDSQLVKAEETGQSNFATLEEPTAEDNATNEIGPPADIKKEHELESVEEIKYIDATEAEKASHTSQAAALEVQLSESNIATTEPTYDIQQVNDLEATKEMKATEAINDEEISCQRTEIAVLEDQSSTDNGTAPEELPVESNKENFGDENDNVMLVHEKIKEEIQEPTELKDEASNLGEKTVFTTQKGENITEVDAVQISGEDIIETSHNIDQIKEEQKAVTEHDSSQMSSGQREENITHVQDRDIKGEFLTESGTEEVSQASFENDPQAAQDVAEKDDTIKSGEQTNEEDNEKHHDLVLQTQVCERSMDALAIGQQDEDVQKVNLDQQQKEGEEIEVQTEEIQTDEQKHDDKGADFTTEPLVEPQSVEVVTNRTDDTDFFEAERTEMVVTEMLKNEHTLHVPQESIPRITDANVENITERKEGTEEEHEPNNAGPLDADAENYNEDEQENAEKDVVVAKASTDEHYETTDEIRNEEKNIEIPDEQEPLVIQVELGLSSSVEKDFQEITDPAPSNDEMQENVSDENLATTEHNGVEDEAMQQKFDSPNAETNNDDILSISNPLPEHETGTASDITQNRQYQEAINADDVLQLEPEENAFDKIAETDSNEKMETSHTAATKAVTFHENTCDKASGADGALSNESLKTFEDARRNLDVSSVVTASKGDNINEEMEDRKLALPAQTTLDKNTTEQGSGLEETERELSLSEKPLPSEPEEQEENRITKEKDEEDTHEPEIGDTQKEAEESDLPVSNFLMNLILGKESNDPNGNSESKAEKKQEETTKDDSCSITFQQEESSVSFPAENKVDDKLIFEQEKQNVEGSEETHETVKEQSHDFKLDTQRSLEIDEELNRNTHDSEAPVYQDNAQDEISSELVPGEATGVVTETETREFELDEKAVSTICQEDVEATAQIEEGSLNSNLDDSTSPKASQEDTLDEGRTELFHESLPEDRSSHEVVEQTLSLTEPDMGDAEKLPNDTDGLESPLCTKQEESIESSNAEAKSTIEVQLESEVDKKEEKHHATTLGATEEQIENVHDNSQKGTGSEAISDEQAPEITEPVIGSGTDINLAREKEISEGSTCMDKIESYNFSNNEKALEIQSDGPNLHINQDKQDESADSRIVIEKNNLLDRPGESNLQEQQETHSEQKSPKETDEGYHKFLVIKEPVIKEENVHETVEIHVKTVNKKPNEEQEADSQVQERDLGVVSPKEAPEVEESFVVITKPEFSTDEEQSPKADESNMAEEKTYDEKTKDEEEAKNFTDEVTMKIEERGAGQNASHKKHILSGVRSKVKHQLAKVKKAIIGKPGHTKSESPKS